MVSLNLLKSFFNLTNTETSHNCTDLLLQLSILSQLIGVVMMRQILILTILYSQVCRGFVFSPSPIENSVEDISVEYDAESLNLVSQDFMEQKTKNEFDDKVLKRKFYCPI